MGCVGDQQQPAGRRGYLEALAERADEVDFISGPERGSRVPGWDEYVKSFILQPGGEDRGTEVAAEIGQHEAARSQPQRDCGSCEDDPREGAACFYVCGQCVCLYHLHQLINLPITSQVPRRTMPQVVRCVKFPTVGSLFISEAFTAAAFDKPTSLPFRETCCIILVYNSHLEIKYVLKPLRALADKVKQQPPGLETGQGAFVSTPRPRLAVLGNRRQVDAERLDRQHEGRIVGQAVPVGDGGGDRRCARQPLPGGVRLCRTYSRCCLSAGSGYNSGR